MAVVYLAEERKHGRAVAVKVLRPELAATVCGSRFLNEISIAAQLQHPNILGLYDSGDVAGLLYYVMPYLEGETLAERLRREGRVPASGALPIIRDIASALDYAHRHDVAHRDIKPGNILLCDGRAVVFDFGIAKAFNGNRRAYLTREDGAVGTPEYMSPEQVGGDPDVDGRSDVYSLACVLYEMVSGSPPFIGLPRTVMAHHLSATPRPLEELCPSVSPALSAAVRKGLEKDPANRYASAGQFVGALTDQRAPDAPRDLVVGVLPFVNVNGIPAVDGHGAEITTQIVAALDTVRHVRATTLSLPSSMDGKSIYLTEIGRRLDVNALLLGSFRDRSVREITVELVDTRTGGRPLRDRFYQYGNMGSLAAEEIAEAVARALANRLWSAERGVPNRSP